MLHIYFWCGAQGTLLNDPDGKPPPVRTVVLGIVEEIEVLFVHMLSLGFKATLNRKCPTVSPRDNAGKSAGKVGGDEGD